MITLTPTEAVIAGTVFVVLGMLIVITVCNVTNRNHQKHQEWIDD